MTYAIVLREPGGPEKLLWEPIEVPDPGPEQILVRHTAIGVNFHDTYVRSGQYQTLKLPGIPGVEAAGVVEKLGEGVTGLAVGDRITYIDSGYGGYAQKRILPARLAVRIPDTLSDDAAASLTIKGFTACMLVRIVHAVRAGETLLIHAAAGAVGQPLVRWAKHLGATVIATVGSDEKMAIARGCGADHVIHYGKESFVERVAQITDQKGVNVAYDSVGASTFLGSVQCLGYFGTVVNFGQSSGPVAPFSPALLAARSNAVVRPMLFHYIRDRVSLEAMAAEVFTAIAKGVIREQPLTRLPLSRAGEAHILIESRKTAGAVVLRP
jgi:NADPH:quinone reductase